MIRHDACEKSEVRKDRKRREKSVRKEGWKGGREGGREYRGWTRGDKYEFENNRISYLL